MKPNLKPKLSLSSNFFYKRKLYFLLYYTPGIINIKVFYRVPNEDIIYVFYASLNFKDIMMASGKLQNNSQMARQTIRPTDSYTHIGCEFAGIQNGKRVAGLCTHSSFALQCLDDWNLTWEIPDHWTMEDAATVPMAYSTVSVEELSIRLYLIIIRISCKI